MSRATNRTLINCGVLARARALTRPSSSSRRRSCCTMPAWRANCSTTTWVRAVFACMAPGSFLIQLSRRCGPAVLRLGASRGGRGTGSLRGALALLERFSQLLTSSRTRRRLLRKSASTLCRPCSTALACGSCAGNNPSLLSGRAFGSAHGAAADADMSNMTGARLQACRPFARPSSRLSTSSSLLASPRLSRPSFGPSSLSSIRHRRLLTLIPALCPP